MRASIIVVGAAAALLAGCGSIGSSASPAASAAKASPSPGQGGNGIVGQLVQLNSGKMTISDQAGEVTVTFDSTTSVVQSGSGSLADAAVGTCVLAAGTSDPSGAVTASTFQVQLNMNGNCAAAAGFGGQGGQGTRTGRGSPAPGASPGANRPPANQTLVRGKVASVSGDTVVVQPDTGAPVTVTVPSTVRITRLVSSTSARLAVGECITANGQRDAAGTVKARTLLISAPGPNGCTRGGFGGGRLGASPSPGG